VFVTSATSVSSRAGCGYSAVILNPRVEKKDDAPRQEGNMTSRVLHRIRSGVLRVGWTSLGAILALLACPGQANAQIALLDHFMCYTVTGTSVNTPVQLQDQFDLITGIIEQATVTRPAFFCNPVRKTRNGQVTEIRNINNHLKWYKINTATVPSRKVVLANQFTTAQTLTVGQPQWLAVPTRKDQLPPPSNLDHFKCYSVKGASLNQVVTLEDQFELDKNFVVLKPLRLCNPVRKQHGGIVTEITNPEAHLVCYDVARPLQAVNQFGTENLLVRKMTLCVPSTKRLQ